MNLRYLTVAAAAVALAGACQSQANAGVIPYPNAGSTAPYTPLVGTGSDVVAYFAGTGAGFYETVGLLVNGVLSPAGYVFPNKDTAIGTTIDLGFAPAGSSVGFALQVFDSSYQGNYPVPISAVTNSAGHLTYTGTPSYTLYSDPLFNPDASNHTYVTSYSPTSAIPVSGTYVGFEDLLFGGPPYPSGSISDKNYTDEQFVFTGIAPAAVPEASSFALMGLGLLPLGLIARRRLARRAA